RFIQRALDDLNIWNLAAKMEMQKLETVRHSDRLQLFQAAQHLGHRETELRAISSGTLPASATASGEFHTHADLRANANLGGVFHDESELRVFLDDGNHLTADLLSEHGHLDEFRILEAVTNDERVVVCLRHDGEQFGL